jgi:hypothetical protein
MSAAHVADYHLFKVETAIEFVSLSVQIVKWVREYQDKLFNGIMKDRPSPTTVSTVKRDHESDNEDPEGDIRSKRQKTTTEPAGQSTESSVVDAAEPGTYTPDSPLESECQCPPNQLSRDRDIIAYLEVPSIIRTLSLQFLESGVTIVISWRSI